MSGIRVAELWGQNFRSYATPFHVHFPTAGVVLLRGKNLVSGDSSDAGKSTLIYALAYVLAEAPFPATELKGRYSDTPMSVGCRLITDAGDVVVERSQKGRRVTPPGEPKPLVSVAADAYLTELFGLDPRLRALTMFQFQDAEGILDLPDDEKRAYLVRIVPGLRKFEAEADRAAKEAARLAPLATTARTKAGQDKSAANALVQAYAAYPVPLDAEDYVATARVARDAVKLLRAEAAVVRADIDPEHERAARADVDAAEAARAEAYSQVDPLLGAAQKALDPLLAQHEAARAAHRDAVLAVERRRAEVRVVLAGLNGPSEADALVEIERVSAEIAEIRAGRCPRCTQPWLTGDLDEALVRLDRANAERQRRAAIAVQRRAATEELARLVDPPKPADLLRLEAECAQARAALAAAEARAGAAAAPMRAAADARVGAARAALRGIQNAATEAANLRRTELLEKVAQHETVAAKAEALAARYRAETEARQAASVRAMTAADEAFKSDQAALELECSLAVERGVADALGRDGYLGVAFDLTLNEVADEANAMLAEVANTAHVVVGFEAGDRNKIVPWIQLPDPDGRAERRPMRGWLSGGMGSAVKLVLHRAFGRVAARHNGAYPRILCIDEGFNGLGPVSHETIVEMLQTRAGDDLVVLVDHSAEFGGLFNQVIETETGVDRRSRVV